RSPLRQKRRLAEPGRGGNQRQPARAAASQDCEQIATRNVLRADARASELRLENDGLRSGDRIFESLTRHHAFTSRPGIDSSSESPWVKPALRDARSRRQAGSSVEMNSTRTVRITVSGRLSERLAAAFDGMTLVQRTGTADLVGEVVDQAQLYGLLTRIRDLALELTSLTVFDADSRT